MESKFCYFVHWLDTCLCSFGLRYDSIVMKILHVSIDGRLKNLMDIRVVVPWRLFPCFDHIKHKIGGGNLGDNFYLDRIYLRISGIQLCGTTLSE